VHPICQLFTVWDPCFPLRFSYSLPGLVIPILWFELLLVWFGTRVSHLSVYVFGARDPQLGFPILSLRLWSPCSPTVRIIVSLCGLSRLRGARVPLLRVCFICSLHAQPSGSFSRLVLFFRSVLVYIHTCGRVSCSIAMPSEAQPSPRIVVRQFGFVSVHVASLRYHASTFFRFQNLGLFRRSVCSLGLLTTRSSHLRFALELWDLETKKVFTPLGLFTCL